MFIPDIYVPLEGAHQPCADYMIGHPIGKRQACLGCPMHPTKPGKSVACDADLYIIAWLEWFDGHVGARRALGENVTAAELTALEWEIWQMWSSLKEIYATLERQQMIAMLAATRTML